jgi:hypothetical protein
LGRLSTFGGQPQLAAGTSIAGPARNRGSARSLLTILFLQGQIFFRKINELNPR